MVNFYHVCSCWLVLDSLLVSCTFLQLWLNPISTIFTTSIIITIAITIIIQDYWGKAITPSPSEILPKCDFNSSKHGFGFEDPLSSSFLPPTNSGKFHARNSRKQRCLGWDIAYWTSHEFYRVVVAWTNHPGLHIATSTHTTQSRASPKQFQQLTCTTSSNDLPFWAPSKLKSSNAQRWLISDHYRNRQPVFLSLSVWGHANKQPMSWGKSHQLHEFTNYAS